jgi:type 1 glutamine amidotransferase
MQVHLIAAGKYHDIDFARLELLKLLAEIPEIRTSVAMDFANLDRLREADLLITYTCDLMPNGGEVAGLTEFLERGGRWLALHGTNSILRFDAAGKVETPDEAPEFMALLGTRFTGHPPIEPFKVHVTKEHELTRGFRSFTTLDELYLCDVTADIETLMHSDFAGGTCSDFADPEFGPQQVPILYFRTVGAGAVLYCSLGHCRGHYDLRPLANFWPTVQRCSWDYPEFLEIVRRGIRWGVAGQS